MHKKVVRYTVHVVVSASGHVNRAMGVYNTTQAPTNTPLNATAKLVRRGADTENECMPSAAFDVAAAAAAQVATVYSDPAKLVTTPAPLVASVMASPPAEVTIV